MIFKKKEELNLSELIRRVEKYNEVSYSILLVSFFTIL